MSYRRLIRYDYRIRLQWGRPTRRRGMLTGRTLRALLLAIAGSAVLYGLTGFIETTSNALPSVDSNISSIALTLPERISLVAAAADHNKIALPFEPKVKRGIFASDPWKSIEVKSGDTASYLFERLALSKTDLHRILEIGGVTSSLKRLRPQQQIRVRVEDGKLQELLHEQDLITALHVTRTSNGFRAEQLHIEPERRIAISNAIIKRSLFMAGQEAGLSDNLIMQLASVFGWDIDFVLDIREGDQFVLIYEELLKDGQKVKDGSIIAAQFSNRGRTFRAVRYTDPNHSTDYYSDSGRSMRKAFLRTPVKFSRISSRFNLQRKHPILNTIRAHRGVDYAAPTGTPIKATGDGKVILAGNNGGYGKAIVLQHGGQYSTLYGHLSRISRGVVKGHTVKQGQIIGYVGSTGLATGPHLHYEFRVNGVHRNPLTVELPRALPIPKEQEAEFLKQTAPFLAALEKIDNGRPDTVDKDALLARLQTIQPATDLSLAQARVDERDEKDRLTR
jgi:murein DD-endopeptidase MepM/ murein hydrolase activator NlpD